MNATPPQVIDPDALDAVRDAFRRGEQWHVVRDMILALVRPVEGITLSPEEAAYARRWLPTANSQRARDLAARLEEPQ